MSNITIKQVIDSFILSCKVEGKSYGTIVRRGNIPNNNRQQYAKDYWQVRKQPGNEERMK